MESKKKYLKVIIILFIIIGLSLIIKPINKKQEVNVINEAKEQNNFAIYKQDASGSYILTNDSTFPTQGYILNLENSKCYDYEGNPTNTNGLSQASDGKIIIETNATKYCDLYFAKDDDVPVVNTFTIIGVKENNETLKSGYTHKVNVTYNIGWSATDVVSYCISTSQSSCNGSWVNVSGTSVSPTEPVLDSTEGKKTRYAFLKDRANNISSGKEASITLDLNNPTVSNVTYKSKDTNSITVNVTGSDTPNGSGVVKYECKATTQSTWYQQDTNGNCKVTDLNDNTSYTIEGRVTDASGRVSTNSVSVTQSTEAAYSCSAGEELVQDAEKGSSSGGYICKASASSKGWSKEETYYTCSANSSYEYSKQSEAENACKGSTQRSCSSVSEQSYSCSTGILFGAGCIQNGSWGWTMAGAGKSMGRQCTDLSDTVDYSHQKVVTVWDAICKIESDTVLVQFWECGDGSYGYSIPSIKYVTVVDENPEGKSPCLVATSAQSTTQTKYQCPVNSKKYTSESSCNQSCLETTSLGSVSSHSKTVYSCPSGWSIYSGSGSSLECYRGATRK